ncbi:PAS domain-containing protein [Dongia sp.]|uniref:PAS domain-containing protein n=1 Tax=Dongia sp. TaxID=1977262 RepID=UPI003752B388
MPKLIADPLQAAASPMGAIDSRVAAYVAQSGRSVLPADAAAPETPEARALWSWWRGAAAAGRQPHRNDFDVVENRQLAAHLYLVEPVTDGFRLRLAGEVFEQLFRRRRGHIWRRDDGEPLARAFAGYFDFVTEQAQPYRSLGRMKCEYSDWFSFESLLCPLRHADGVQLLGVAARVPEPGF